jgi:hypothetical protein
MKQCLLENTGLLAILVGATMIGSAQGDRVKPPDRMVQELLQLSPDVYPTQSDEAKRLRQAWPELLRDGLRQANRRSTQQWQGLQSRADWEQFRREKLAKLRQALAIPEAPPPAPRVIVTGRIRGEGYRIENLLYESRPGLWVSANLYLPEPIQAKPAGLILVHSHHTPKWHTELQDMGILWAKAGSAVLVPDLLGHGERRTHPFADAKSFPEPFRVGRQDYYFRYNTAAQLYLLGETLMGWMVWDLRCGVEVLLKHAQADPQRIGILGSVAGGGDVAGVTAAVEERISAAVVFNFGGPEPEDPFPLPDDAEVSFNYAGSGSWESTRNLIHSARDGFLPWVIVGAIAPRRLCYAHEFSWDRERDPVWRRLQRIWAWYEVPEHLRYAHGRGQLSGKPPESTHCTHIGEFHRRSGVYQALQAWFGLPIPQHENTTHYSITELTCWTEEARRQLRPLPWPEWLSRWYEQQKASIKTTSVAPTANEVWAGWVKRNADRQKEPARPALLRQQAFQGGRAQWWLVSNLDGMPIPVVLLLADTGGKQKPGVVAVCSQGKARFLREHAGAVAQLLASGVDVCLVDVRGVGETATESVPSRTGAGTSHAATALMLGQSVVELRLLDLLAVVGDEQSPRADNAPKRRIAVWGTDEGPVNGPAIMTEVPWDASRLPAFADPTGPHLALRLAALNKEVVAVYAAGELASYRSALASPFLFLPLAAIEPGMLDPKRGRGDPADLLPGLAPRPVRLEALRDARNRLLNDASVQSWLADLHATLRQYGHRQPETWLQASSQRSSDTDIALWLLRHLHRNQ